MQAPIIFHITVDLRIETRLSSVLGDKYEAVSTDNGYNKFMMLKIRSVSKSDFGSYKCVAKNSLGETDGVIKLDGKSPCIFVMELTRSDKHMD
jgi:hypothetical protein